MNITTLATTIKVALCISNREMVVLYQRYLMHADDVSVASVVQHIDVFTNQIEDVENGKLPDVMLLESNLKHTHDLEAIRRCKEKCPQLKIVVITEDYQAHLMKFLLNVGVAAYLPQSMDRVRVLAMIRAVYSRGVFLYENQLCELQHQNVGSLAANNVFKDQKISTREMEVLQLICQQKTAKEIGDILFITAKTVEGHKNNLFLKTGVKNVVGLVIYAVQNNLIRLEEIFNK